MDKGSSKSKKFIENKQLNWSRIKCAEFENIEKRNITFAQPNFKK